MKYLKHFEQAFAYEAYKNGSDYVLPNVSYVVETKGVKYDSKKSFKLRAKYNATPDNLVAFNGASNIKAMKVNGNSITIEPIKNENTTFDVLGENISLDMETGLATLPESYLIKSPVTSWSFKAKDPNYVINENTYACMFGMMGGETMAQPIPLAEVMGYAFTTNDGVTLELTDTFLAQINVDIQSGLQIGFTLVDVDMNNETFVFIDTAHQTNVTTGGLPTYSFDNEGLYDVEIELTDPDRMGIGFAGTPLISIEIGDGITTIDEYTFSDCTGLTEITIPDSVTYIGDGAFESCSGLTSITIPDSVTTIAYSAFYECTGLTSIAIPNSVTSISEYTFSGCIGLTLINIPDSVTTIGNAAFYNCSGLTNVTIGSGVTSIGESAFSGCSELTSINIPDSVTSIGANAFDGCSNLVSITIPDSVTTIGDYAFYDCTELTSVNIPNSVTSIGDYAFMHCSGLTNVTIGSGVTSIGESAFSNCNSIDEIICKGNIAPQIQYNTFGDKYNSIKKSGILKVPSGSDYSTWMSNDDYYLGYYNWTIEYPYVFDMSNYLTIEALEDGLTASLSVNACEYCVDGDSNWKTLAADTSTESINTGQTLSFRGELTPVSYTGIGTFTISKKCNLKGNCMSMLFGDNAANNYSLEGKSWTFYKLFRDCTNILNVSKNFLPATSLADSCYSNMFRSCTRLTTAPELPATTLADNCYDAMFRNCSSLTAAPELPATTLAEGCYSNMFYNCSSLTAAPELPATSLANSCYSNMFRSCTRLTTAPELPATTLANYCYQYMFSYCSSLTTAPELPATTLTDCCYNYMFLYCTRLTTAPELPATTLATNCYNAMFSYCSSLTTAPELPATTLANYCYSNMFSYCTKLNYIKMLATDISASTCLNNWVNNVASSGTFVKNPAMTSLPTGNSGIPEGWTVVDAA